jgi:hypothetical protein
MVEPHSLRKPLSVAEHLNRTRPAESPGNLTSVARLLEGIGTTIPHLSCSTTISLGSCLPYGGALTPDALTK